MYLQKSYLWDVTTLPVRPRIVPNKEANLFNVFFPVTLMTIKKYCKTILGHFYTVSAHYLTHECIFTNRRLFIQVVLKTWPDICFQILSEFLDYIGTSISVLKNNVKTSWPRNIPMKRIFYFESIHHYSCKTVYFISKMCLKCLQGLAIIYIFSISTVYLKKNDVFRSKKRCFCFSCG